MLIVNQISTQVASHAVLKIINKMWNRTKIEQIKRSKKIKDNTSLNENVLQRIQVSYQDSGSSNSQCSLL
jgi:hypothetical protein